MAWHSRNCGSRYGTLWSAADSFNRATYRREVDTSGPKPLIGEMVTEEDIKTALKAVKYPGYSRDIVSFGLVKEVAVNNGAVSLTMQLTGGSAEAAQQIKTESERVLKGLA